MLWLFDCQRAFVHDVLNRKTVHDVVNVIKGSSREVAWLDITMNSGNSGGPVILMGNRLEDDKVIGIATFGLNPFADPAKELIEIVKTFPGNVFIMGVDFKKFGTLVGSALATTSLGVNGCVSIDYLKMKLP
jgi:hypothetical protein